MGDCVGLSGANDNSRARIAALLRAEGFEVVESRRSRGATREIDPPAVLVVVEPGKPVARRASRKRARMNENQQRCASLSPRERDVLECLKAGCSNKAIARELTVCEATVKVHVKAILRKLNVHNRTQAAIWASSMPANDRVPALTA